MNEQFQKLTSNLIKDVTTRLTARDQEFVRQQSFKFPIDVEISDKHRPLYARLSVGRNDELLEKGFDGFSNLERTIIPLLLPVPVGMVSNINLEAHVRRYAERCKWLQDDIDALLREIAFVLQNMVSTQITKKELPKIGSKFLVAAYDEIEPMTAKIGFYYGNSEYEDIFFGDPDFKTNSCNQIFLYPNFINMIIAGKIFRVPRMRVHSKETATEWLFWGYENQKRNVRYFDFSPEGGDRFVQVPDPETGKTVTLVDCSDLARLYIKNVGAMQVWVERAGGIGGTEKEKSKQRKIELRHVFEGMPR